MIATKQFRKDASEFSNSIVRSSIHIACPCHRLIHVTELVRAHRSQSITQPRYCPCGRILFAVVLFFLCEELYRKTMVSFIIIRIPFIMWIKRYGNKWKTKTLYLQIMRKIYCDNRERGCIKQVWFRNCERNVFCTSQVSRYEFDFSRVQEILTI